MKKTKQTPETKPTIGHTFKPITDASYERQRKARDEGRNEHYADLASAGLGKLLLENYQHFTLSDFIAISSSLDLSYAERKSWFEAFVEQQKKAKRITEIPSCYSMTLYKVI